ncbi:NepR family anti-sigma factor [Roseovarius aestuariivivens]|uniref:NepR family anti-sigma factor n=1 Tax=Roseovarius aestuariivivens TaxID=1888910 RepID=UPI001FD8AC0D|nr:NepR family anti-sigma factor [Roseovarius aestuariivivens]
MSYMKPKLPKSRVVEEIDRNLKQVFDSIANEPMPDRFAELLDRLKTGDTSVAKGTTDDNEDK